MGAKKIVWISVAAILLIAAIIDCIRYLKPDVANKQKVQQQSPFLLIGPSGAPKR